MNLAYWETHLFISRMDHLAVGRNL